MCRPNLPSEPTAIMGFSLHAANTDDPPEVRNWRIHLMAVIVSMGSVAMGYDTSVIGGTSRKSNLIRDVLDITDHLE